MNKMPKKGLFFISDYRDVDCKPGGDAFWILKELDKNNKFKVYSTANEVIDSSCFKNIDFLPINYKGNIQIQRPMYNYGIYKAYKKVKDKVAIIHHREMFQYQRGYNLIPILSSDMEDKAFIVGPIELSHKVFEDDFLADLDGSERFFKKIVYQNRNNLGKLWKFLFKKTIEHADKVIVPDEEVKKALSNYISSSKIEKINYGADLSIYRKYKYEADENNYDVVFAGSAIERKGVKYLLGAIPMIKKYFPEVKLHLRTAGYKVEEYKKIIKELDISENVFFQERLEINKYLELLSKSRLLCLPTLSEGYGWTILDALCLGVPVVTTTECRCNELFKNGKIGLQVEPGAPEKIADAILKLFNDFELCKKFSENGLKKREEFDYKKIIPKYEELYEKYI
jgi:glycosyltransferase involved in cell wall biosynthesis